MGGRSSLGNRNTGNVTISVRERWGYEEITNFEDKRVENAVNEVKETIQEVLKMSENDVDRAYEYLADYYPYTLYDDDGTKIINNRDEHHIIGVEVSMSEYSGKVDVILRPRVFDKSDFLTREELDAVGLYERRK